MYHRFLTKTPSQQQVLQERARQRQKLRERNQRLAPPDFGRWAIETACFPAWAMSLLGD